MRRVRGTLVEVLLRAGVRQMRLSPMADLTSAALLEVDPNDLPETKLLVDYRSRPLRMPVRFRLLGTEIPMSFSSARSRYLREALSILALLPAPV